MNKVYVVSCNNIPYGAFSTRDKALDFIEIRQKEEREERRRTGYPVPQNHWNWQSFELDYTWEDAK